jgi:hypothetical protein
MFQILRSQILFLQILRSILLTLFFESVERWLFLLLAVHAERWDRAHHPTHVHPNWLSGSAEAPVGIGEATDDQQSQIPAGGSADHLVTAGQGT